MPRYILKIRDKFCEWSTVVDAPVTHLMSEEEFKEHYRFQYGAQGMEGLQQRMERVAKNGCSSLLGETAEEMIEGNRAGENETELTEQQIWDKYQK